MEIGRWWGVQWLIAAVDGEVGSGVGGGGAPVVRSGGGVVRRVRQLEAETLVESSEVGDVRVDRGELGELLLRRAADELGMMASGAPG